MYNFFLPVEFIPDDSSTYEMIEETYYDYSDHSLTLSNRQCILRKYSNNTNIWIINNIVYNEIPFDKSIIDYEKLNVLVKFIIKRYKKIINNIEIYYDNIIAIF